MVGKIKNIGLFRCKANSESDPRNTNRGGELGISSWRGRRGSGHETPSRLL